MRYWQITLRRLSRAADKLDKDGQWHPFHSADRSWYRVWKNKLVQRATFESVAEEEALLPLVQALEPLPELASVSGFREEIRLQLAEDGLVTRMPLGYETAALDQMRLSLAAYSIRLEVEETVVYAVVPVEALTARQLTIAQMHLTAVRLYFQAAATAEDTTTAGAAAAALKRMMDDTASLSQ